MLRCQRFLRSLWSEAVHVCGQTPQQTVVLLTRSQKQELKDMTGKKWDHLELCLGVGAELVESWWLRMSQADQHG